MTWSHYNPGLSPSARAPMAFIRPTLTQQRSLATVLDVITVLAVVLLMLALAGGTRFRVGELIVSVRDPLRPLVALVVAAGVRWGLWRWSFLPVVSRAAIARLIRWARRGAMLLPHACVVGLLLWSVSQAHDATYGFSRLLLFGQEFEDTLSPELRTLPIAMEPGFGYDGQFYGQLALDPLLRRPSTIEALDTARYRARRVLFPAMAYVAGWGDPARIIEAYALINVGSWLALALLLLRWLTPGSARHFAAWSGCLLSHGLLVSVHRSLLDGPSVLLLAVAVVALERNRPWMATAILAVSGLGRETNLLGSTSLVDRSWWSRDGDRASHVRRAVLTGGALVIPAAVWFGYVTAVTPAPVNALNENFAWPLVGFAGHVRDSILDLQQRGWMSYAGINLLTLIALVTQAAFLIARRQWNAPWWRLGVAYAALMVVLGADVWDGDPGAITRVVLPMTFAFNLLVPRHRWFWPLWVLGNAHLVYGLDTLSLS